LLLLLCITGRREKKELTHPALADEVRKEEDVFESHRKKNNGDKGGGGAERRKQMRGTKSAEERPI